VRYVLTLVAVALIALAFVVTGTDPAPDIDFDNSVPDDLRALAAQTWDDFLAAHPARRHCIDPVTLSAAWELDSRGEYRPEAATVVVRVPGTAPNLRHQMIHEFAHHLEFVCPEHEDLRTNFLAAQGFPSSAPWFGGETWEATPSEHYAEATVEVLLGRRSHHGNIRISEQASAIVRRWGTGS